MCFAPQRRALFPCLIWPAGSAPAALASLLFDPPEPQIIGKTQCFADFPIFSRICIFFLLIFSLLTLLTSAFQLSILSEVSLLNFLRLIYEYTYIIICNINIHHILIFTIHISSYLCNRQGTYKPNICQYRDNCKPCEHCKHVSISPYSIFGWPPF